MKEFPEVRFVGNAKKSEKKAVLADLITNNNELGFLPEDWEDLILHEYLKTDYETELTQQVIKTVYDYIESLGLKDNYTLSHYRFHLLPRKYYNQAYRTINAKTNEAFAVYTHQEVVMDGNALRGSPVRLAMSELHELIHLKGHLAINVKSKENYYGALPYRTGMTAYGVDLETFHAHFDGLEEAITAAITKHLLDQMLNSNEILAKQKKILNGEDIRNYLDSEIKKTSKPADEFYWLYKKPNEEDTTLLEHPYWSQRVVLYYICNEVSAKFNDEYSSPDDVLKKFAKAHFTGHLLEIGNIVENTFGSGSFRVLGEMTDDEDSAIPVAKKLHEMLNKSKKIK